MKSGARILIGLLAVCGTITLVAQPTILTNDPELEALQEVPEALAALLEQANALESAESSPADEARQSAADVLRDPRFSTRIDNEGPDQDSWLEGPFQRMGDRLADLLERLFSQQREVNAPNPIPLLGILTPLAWGVIVALIVGLLVWVLLRFRVERGAKRVGGLLDEDEEELSADEWLKNAEKQAASGDYRRAIRSLYLASLMRCDQSEVANFRRWETNWEHLYRIQASPKAPRSFDFRDYTRRFDLVWYGRQIKGESDYTQYRSDYLKLTETLSESPKSEEVAV